jgi:hypothetical protein
MIVTTEQKAADIVARSRAVVLEIHMAEDSIAMDAVADMAVGMAGDMMIEMVDACGTLDQVGSSREAEDTTSKREATTAAASGRPRDMDNPLTIALITGQHILAKTVNRSHDNFLAIYTLSLLLLVQNL